DKCNYSQTWYANYTDGCDNPAVQKSVTYTWKVDTEAPDLIVPNGFDDNNTMELCNDYAPDSITIDWTDNCGVGGLTSGTLMAYKVLAGDDGCVKTYTYSYMAEDDCENKANLTLTVTQEFDRYENCETMFAKARGGDDGEATCFIPEFSRWGWTNFVSQGTSTMDLYAGAAHCDTSKGAHVGTATVNYSGGNMTVTYSLTGNYVMSEAHVYVGCERYPATKKGSSTVAPGQYNFNPGGSLDYLNEYTVNISGLSGDDMYVIIHGVVCEEICRCTPPDSPRSGEAYPNGEAFCPNGEFYAQEKATDFTAYPVPFDSEVTIKYSFGYETDVKIEVFDMKGALIKVDEDSSYLKGSIGKTTLDLTGIADQLLFVRLTTSNGVVTKKILSSDSAR
uniref:T9SS type A sorting domain-containing protein n=1 Tax=Seonamhaeicola maritimus TaxID=2591822 RepID=UPI0024940E6A